MTCLLCNTPAAPKGLQLLIVGDGVGGLGFLEDKGAGMGPQTLTTETQNPCCAV